MGNKGGKNKPSKTKHNQKLSSGLSKHDYAYLTSQTGYSKPEIKKFYDQFIDNTPNGQLDRQEFVRFYSKLRAEPQELLDKISNFVFKAFDEDNNGYISFNEFMIAYVLTIRGDPKKKLEYAFDLYDADNNGLLDMNEVRSVLVGMLGLLDANNQAIDVSQLAEECCCELDKNGDGKISKEEFIEGLLKNYSLRVLMSPFN